MKERLVAQNVDLRNAAIVVLNTDDMVGRSVVNKIVAGVDWSAQRDPDGYAFARAPVTRSFLTEIFGQMGMDIVAELNDVKDALAVVVVDFGVAGIYKA